MPHITNTEHVTRNCSNSSPICCSIGIINMLKRNSVSVFNKCQNVYNEVQQYCDLMKHFPPNLKVLTKRVAYSFNHGATAPVGQGPLIFDDSWSHSVTHTTLGRTPLDEWSVRRKRPLPDNTQHSQQTDRQTDSHAPGGIRIHSHSKREAADQHIRLRGHWDRQSSL
jgi:hypothetical protein